MIIFFDTEFTELGLYPRLISIGLISEDGERTFYAELSDTYKPRHCSDFVHEVVLPLLEGGNARMTQIELAARLGNWIESFEQPVRLATDSESWDWPWIHEIFSEAQTWPENLSREPLLLTTDSFVDAVRFVNGVEKAFLNLRRHHSLDDAKANRMGWIAAGRNLRQ